MRNRAAEARSELEAGDPVRANTSENVNERLDREMRERVRDYARRGPEAISRRIDELDREWDMERYLEMNAAALAATGVALGATRSKRWLIAPAIVLTFLFQHATQGWCPPVPLFRRWGIRTRKEIERERYSLKALRGDFDVVAGADSIGVGRAGRAIEAVNA